MIVIEMETRVDAPMERVFDLARSIDFHSRSLAHAKVPGAPRHRFAEFDRPKFFQDTMVRGAFAWMQHDHAFEPAPGGGTVMRDVLRFAAPLGILGRIAEYVLLRRYMTRFLQVRNAELKRVAESDAWREFLGSVN